MTTPTNQRLTAGEETVQSQLEEARREAAEARARNRWLLAALNATAVVCFAVWWWHGSKVRRRAALEGEGGVPSGLLPHVARWLSAELFQRLVSHRAALLQSQQQAELEMAQLEDRLAKVHAPLADRLRAYEVRIGELERQLAAKGEENRELLQAKIQRARQKLASERSKERPATG